MGTNKIRRHCPLMIHPPPATAQWYLPELADLNWLLTSAPLITALKQSPNTIICDGLFERSKEELHRQLVSRSHRGLVQRANFNRLGLYAEALYRYFCEHLSGAKLVAHNIQVTHQGTGVTKGELDFLIDAYKGLMHLEMAVKFYLFDSQQRRFIGPNMRDRLDKKLQRLVDHQLPLSHSQEGKAILTRMGSTPVETGLLLKGVLFHHWQERKPDMSDGEQPHFTISSHAEWGLWTRQREWPEFLANYRHHMFRAIPKMAWMGLMDMTPTTIGPITGEQLILHPLEDSLGLWLCTKNNGEDDGLRIMVVPDHWPQSTNDR